MDILHLDPQVLEDLKEIGNIGTGHAASRLSEKINQRCMVNIPEVIVLPVADIKIRFDLERVLAVAVMIKVLGDIPSVMMVLMKKSDAHKLLALMVPDYNRSSHKDFSFMAQYSLRKVGEFLTSSFTEAVGEFLKLRHKLSMPQIIMDSWSTALDQLIAQLEGLDQPKLIIHSRFYGVETPFEGEFIYILNEESTERILEAIGLM